MSDLIERRKVIDLLWYFADECCSSVIEDFEKIPSAEPKRGRWVITGTFADTIHAKCSECKHSQIFYYGKQPTNYCPECGARMTDDD